MVLMVRVVREAAAREGMVTAEVMAPWFCGG